MEAQRSHIHIAHEHAALLRVIEPLQQPDQGGLPRAAAADDGDALAGRDAERDMLQCRSSAAGIRECDALERDSRTASPRLNVARVRRLGDERPRGKQIEDAARGGDAEQALVEELAELAERAEDLDAEHQDDE